MKRSERMAKLKAERKLKMEQRRARMAAKKEGSTKRAYSDPKVKAKASEVYKKALEQGGGAFAAKKRREFLKDAQYKMDTGATAPAKPKSSRPPRGEPITSGIPLRSAGAIGVTPRNKPKPPRKMDTTDQDIIDDLIEGRTSGSDYYKKGGKVKKGYKKGCSVKKGYKSGGKVRGAGCVTKGVRPCKMR